MRIAICDDQRVFSNEVEKHLDFYAKDNHLDFDVYSFSSPMDLLASNLRFNIAFLDVEMPGMNGIELGKILKEKYRSIILIYITSHNQYLDEALDLNAVRFFEKPIRSDRFYDGLTNILRRIDDSQVSFYLKDKTTIEKIKAEDIVYVEIDRRKTKVVTIDTEYVSTLSISDWKNKLIHSVFVVPHKSFIINLNYITNYKRDELTMNYTQAVPISRNKQSFIHKKFIRYMEEF